MTLKTGQRIAFYASVVINTANMLINFALTVFALSSHDSSRAALDAALTCFAAIAVWLIFTFDRLLQVKRETAESALEEQHASTSLRQLMFTVMEKNQPTGIAVEVSDRPH